MRSRMQAQRGSRLCDARQLGDSPGPARQKKKRIIVSFQEIVDKLWLAP